MGTMTQPPSAPGREMSGMLRRIQSSVFRRRNGVPQQQPAPWQPHPQSRRLTRRRDGVPQQQPTPRHPHPQSQRPTCRKDGTPNSSMQHGTPPPKLTTNTQEEAPSWVAMQSRDLQRTSYWLKELVSTIKESQTIALDQNSNRLVV